ncbi:hypothetical protein [Aquimarina sp. RZ0]|uniref:hypothetical protein n=1 Tax=Aquimarina sp. RZ0 TaxID=2607730 RepID=UPI0011F10C63|nr:hypothetical protein [Aquimarina sp. RZ0]KAA1244534.1 hypothetical protein F0000_16240 [Aquimarina sp. RZ0]
MKVSKNTKKAGWTLIGSMLGFIVAKKYSPKETYPFILIGGFIGTCLGEELINEPKEEKML